MNLFEILVVGGWMTKKKQGLISKNNENCRNVEGGLRKRNLRLSLKSLFSSNWKTKMFVFCQSLVGVGTNDVLFGVESF